VVYVSPLKALAVDIQQNLEAPLREIAAVAGELDGFACTLDVADPDSVRAGVDAAVAALGEIDVLINNAGLGEAKVQGA